MIGELNNHLWQSTLFVALAGLLSFAFRKNRAQVRYWLWFSASFKFFVPFSMLMSLGNRSHRAAHRELTDQCQDAAFVEQAFSRPRRLSSRRSRLDSGNLRALVTSPEPDGASYFGDGVLGTPIS